jgi:peptidyl-prolyl cis-trans isomerase SurA
VKLYKLIVLIFLFVMLTSTVVRSEIADKIIVVVNDEIITLKEFRAVFEPYLKRIEETYQGNDKQQIIDQTKAAILQRLIDNLLIEHEAKKSGTSIKEEEIMGVLKETLAKQNVQMEDFLKKQEREGNSLASIKDEIRAQLMRMKLMRREIKSKITVSASEIGEYYNQHRDEYEGREAVRIKQILFMIPPTADKTTKTKIEENAWQIQKSALGGTAFEMLAAKYSQGAEASQGGDVGFVERGVMIPEVETVAFSLQLDQVSAVIESSLGFHIIKVVDKRGAGLKPITAVREEIKAKLEDEKLEKKYDEWISLLRKKSHIEIR